MRLVTLLLIIYLLFFIVAIIFLDQAGRNYWKRAMIPLLPCPFGKEEYAFHETTILGTRDNREGLFSYSLYGNFDKYLPTLETSLDTIKDLIPTWQGRVYVACNIPDYVVTSLLHRGAEVIVMGPHSPLGHEGALWRFLPLEGDLPFLCLDADDTFTPNTVDQIKAWFKSEQPFCNLSPVIFFVPMTANAWGARERSMPNIRQLLAKYCEHWYGFDEAFLKKEVWPVTQERGCWFTTCLRLDKGVIGYGLVLIILVIYSLWIAMQYQKEF